MGFGSNFTSFFDDAPDPATSNNTLPGTNDRMRMKAWIMVGRKKIAVTLDSGLASSATSTTAPKSCDCCGIVGCSCCVSTSTATVSMGAVHSLKVHIVKTTLYAWQTDR